MSISIQPFDGKSVCLFCGSSDRSDPAYTVAAQEFGAQTAAAGWRLVYGGGGVGLMGASARGAHEAGGRVVGIMPAFLRSRAALPLQAETGPQPVLLADPSDTALLSELASTLDPARTTGEHELLAAYRALGTRQQGALLEVACAMAGNARRRPRADDAPLPAGTARQTATRAAPAKPRKPATRA